MKNSTFRVPMCHASRELLLQFAIKSTVLTKRQRNTLILGGVALIPINSKNVSKRLNIGAKNFIKANSMIASVQCICMFTASY